MAINYEQVGWDTSKYVNPTRMNHMDDGIKAACDKADAHDQQIETINSNFKRIYEDTVTTTTNEYGFFGWICNTDRIIISVSATDRALVPFIFNNAWYVVELNRTASGGLIGEKTFDVTMTYIMNDL